LLSRTFNILQGSVATRLQRREIANNRFIANFFNEKNDLKCVQKINVHVK